MLDDPSSPTIYRASGAPPYPSAHDPPSLPMDVYPRQVTLRDRVTTATIVPFSSQHQVPRTLLSYLSDQLNREIENGDTYPMIETMSTDKFASKGALALHLYMYMHVFMYVYTNTCMCT